MKLESYVIMEALATGDTATAIRALADHYGLLYSANVPVTVIPKNSTVYNITRLLLWCGDDFYEWCCSTGFDRGTHPYSLGKDHTDQIDNIILWI